MIWISPQRRIPLTIALIVGLIVISTIVSRSHGPRPSAGAVYTGTAFVQTRAGGVRERRPVSFRVDASDDRVRAFSFSGGIPSLCAATAGVTVSGTGPIVNPSHFLLRLSIRRIATPVGTLTISGAFHSLGRESGALTTVFTPPGLRGCGASAGYSTRSGAI